MQTKRESMIESITNTSVGALVSLAITWACMKFIQPRYGAEIAAVSSVVLCTIWSLGRSYTLRRIFNKRALKKQSLNGVLVKVMPEPMFGSTTMLRFAAIPKVDECFRYLGSWQRVVQVLHSPWAENMPLEDEEAAAFITTVHMKSPPLLTLE